MKFDYKCTTCGYRREFEVKTSGEDVYCPHCGQEGLGETIMNKMPHGFGIGSSSKKGLENSFPETIDLPGIGRLRDTKIRLKHPTLGTGALYGSDSKFNPELN